VRLIRRPQRGGPSAAQSHAASHATGELLVFSDADCLLDSRALRLVARWFADPAVGAVAGALRKRDAGESATGGGAELLLRYETLVKRALSSAGGLFTASGGLHAVRRRLYSPLPSHHDHDTMVPLHAALQGYRVVFEPRAVAWEAAPCDAAQARRRQIRSIVRDWWQFRDHRFFLWPPRPWIACNILSHHVMRYLTALFAAGALLGSVLLSGQPFYRGMLAAQLLFYGLATLGWCWEKPARRLRLLSAPLGICSYVAASCGALLTVMRGRRILSWQPRSN
jgi:cellulose synthase/poly-beta-1,6-N-acetylglucosamine synthase-like glycosyltransferase